MSWTPEVAEIFLLKRKQASESALLGLVDHFSPGAIYSVVRQQQQQDNQEGQRVTTIRPCQRPLDAFMWVMFSRPHCCVKPLRNYFDDRAGSFFRPSLCSSSRGSSLNSLEVAATHVPDLQLLEQRWNNLELQNRSTFENSGAADETRFVAECLRVLVAWARPMLAEASGGGASRLPQQVLQKRPRNAYMHFYMEQRANFRERHADLNSQELSKKMGEAYRQLSPEQRAPYVQRAEADKRRYRASQQPVDGADAEAMQLNKDVVIGSSSSSAASTVPSSATLVPEVFEDFCPVTGSSSSSTLASGKGDTRLRKYDNATLQALHKLLQRSLERPPSAFLMFSALFRPKLNQLYPTKPGGWVSRLVGHCWRLLGADAKRPYEFLALWLRASYLDCSNRLRELGLEADVVDYLQAHPEGPATSGFGLWCVREFCRLAKEQPNLPTEVQKQFLEKIWSNQSLAERAVYEQQAALLEAPAAIHHQSPASPSSAAQHPLPHLFSGVSALVPRHQNSLQGPSSSFPSNTPSGDFRMFGEAPSAVLKTPFLGHSAAPSAALLSLSSAAPASAAAAADSSPPSAQGQLPAWIPTPRSVILGQLPALPRPPVPLSLHPPPAGPVGASCPPPIVDVVRDWDSVTVIRFLRSHPNLRNVSVELIPAQLSGKQLLELSRKELEERKLLRSARLRSLLASTLSEFLWA